LIDVNLGPIGDGRRPEGSLENNVTFWTLMPPDRPHCENSKYRDLNVFSRFAGRAPQRPELRTDYFVNPAGFSGGMLG
jgi:hypothetical protein